MKEKYGEQLSFRLTESVYLRFMEYCKGRRVVDVLREAIIMYLEAKENAENRDTTEA
jgi:hypothetical protein